MKKFLSVFLALLFLVSSMLAASADGTGDLEVIVISDLHLTARSAIENIKHGAVMTDYPLYSHVGSNGLMWAESEAVLIEFLKRAADFDEEYILIPGDLSNGGSLVGHQRITSLFEEFEEVSGKQIYVINGNHDCKSGFTKENFAQYYQNFGYKQALSRHADSLSYTADLGGKYRLLAIDSCEENESGGSIGEGLLVWIEEQANSAKEEGRHLVAMMHHNLLRHMDGAGIDIAERFMDDRISNADEVWEKLADLNIKYIFTGHAHANDISSRVSSKGNEIFDVETNALAAYPCGYRGVSFTDDAVNIETKFITEIDVSNLPDGYTPEQTELIRTDFTTYAKTTLSVSANYMLRSYLLNPSRILGKLNIDAQSDIGLLLARVLPGMYETLCLPLYKSDTTAGESIAELAEKYGYTLPASEYADVFGAVEEILSAHIKGDENFPASSVEIRLIIDCLKVTAVEALDGLEIPLDKVIEGSRTTIRFTRLKDCISRAAFRDSFVTKLIYSFLTPIIEGVSTDLPPGDLNVSLPSYTQPAAEQPGGLLERLCKLIEYIKALLLGLLACCRNDFSSC